MLSTLPTGLSPSLTCLIVVAEACPADLVEAWAPGRLLVVRGPDRGDRNRHDEGPLTVTGRAPAAPFPWTCVFVVDVGLRPCPVGGG